MYEHVVIHVYVLACNMDICMHAHMTCVYMWVHSHTHMHTQSYTHIHTLIQTCNTLMQYTHAHTYTYNVHTQHAHIILACT